MPTLASPGLPFFTCLVGAVRASQLVEFRKGRWFAHWIEQAHGCSDPPMQSLDYF